MNTEGYHYTGTVNIWTENGIVNSGAIQAKNTITFTIDCQQCGAINTVNNDNCDNCGADLFTEERK